MEPIGLEEVITSQKDMTTLAFDPPDGFSGRNIFPDPVTTPNYMELWEVEKNLNFHDWRMWFGSHNKLPVHFCFIYVMGIFLGQVIIEKNFLSVNKILTLKLQNKSEETSIRL